MTTEQFTSLLLHPQDITAEQTLLIQSVITDYPYFQPARALYLKGLKRKQSFKYNQELKTAAAYTTDRSILFDFITSDSFVSVQKGLYEKKLEEFNALRMSALWKSTPLGALCTCS